jgi:hypothetical protein
MIRERKHRADGHAIFAGFVFLDLLEAHADALAQIGLAHAKILAHHAQPRTELDIYCCAFSGSGHHATSVSASH